MASNSSFNIQTGALEVAETYAKQAAGKIALVTGVSVGGIGEAIARAFAHGGASTVIITGRNDDRLSTIIKILAEAYPSTKFRPLKFDYHSLKTVHQAAEELLNDSSIPQLDFYVGNAGGSTAGPRLITEDGLEQHLSGYVANFRFIELLLPKIRAAAQKNGPGSARIVLLSSGAQVASPFRFSDYNFDCDKPLPDDEKPDWTLFKMLGIQETDQYSENIAYAQCNTAKTLLAIQLNKSLASSPDGIYAFSIHPGIVGSTGTNRFWDNLNEEQRATIESFGGVRSIDQGAASILVAALDPNLKPAKGAYLVDCQVADAPPHAVDPEKAEKLWKFTEDVLLKLGRS